MREAVLAEDKQVRDENISKLTEETKAHLEESFPEWKLKLTKLYIN